MKTSLKANLLKHLIAKKEEGGFTLIELLVVIIIIGILAAIALPSFLNQANKARQSEAQTYAGSVNRAQQAYYLENARFSNDLALLGLGIRSTTDNYNYAINRGGPTDKGADVFARPWKAEAFDTTSALRGFIGTTTLASTTGVAAGEATTVAILCKSTGTPVQTTLTNAMFAVTATDGIVPPTCPTNFAPIK